MWLGDEHESEVDARETLPGLHDQRVSELESAIVDSSGPATLMTKTALRGLAPFVAMVKTTYPRQRDDLRRW